MKKIEDRPKYSQAVVELRKKMHMSQERLADESGVPVTVIKKIELGIYMPPYSTIVKIANVLGGNPYEIMSTDLRTGGSTGYEEYVNKDFKRIQKLLPPQYEIASGISGVHTDDDIIIIYEGSKPFVSAAYSKSQLIIDIVSIQDELKKKYEEELRNRVRILFEKICSPSKDANNDDSQ